MSSNDYSELSNKELTHVVASKDDPTDLELELMQRVDALEEHVEDLHEIIETKEQKEKDGVNA